jgi:hypothetical protein
MGSIKVTKDGVTYECRSVEEAAKLGLLLSGGKSRGRPIVQPGNPADLFNNGGRKFIEVLKEAEAGLTSEEIASKLAIEMQSIPPMILGLRRKAKKLGLDLDQFVTREVEYSKGKPISKYKLTEEGRNKLT